jgi:hypothetical protein
MLRGWVANIGTNCIIFGLMWPGHESSICHIGGEHAHHYTTDRLGCFWNYVYVVFDFMSQLLQNPADVTLNTSWFGISIMCPSWATGLPADWCFS